METHGETNVKPMETQWKTNMGNKWNTHGKQMETQWKNNGKHMQRTCKPMETIGKHQEDQWETHKGKPTLPNNNQRQELTIRM